MSEPQGRSEWTSRVEYRPQPERQRTQPDTRMADDMLEHVSRSEIETADVYRRIEDQLRGVARRLDASERSQTESNRVISKAAVEMNIAAREQAQAFDQLGAHVTDLTERLDRVECRDPGDGLRDAVKALHQGLSRLADQISSTANQSAVQISSLAGNLETVAGRVGQARQDAIAATQALEGRLAAIDERVRAVEATTQAQAGTIERALDAVEAQKRQPSPMEAIVRLEDSVRRLDERGPDPVIDRRLMGIERTVSEVMDRVERREAPSPAVEDNLRRVVMRLESLEIAQRETAAELRKAAAAKPLEAPPPPAPPPPAPPPPAAAAPQQPAAANQAAFGPLPGFEPPPFAAEPPPMAAPPAFAAAAPPFAAAPSFGDPLPNNYELPPDPGFVPAGDAAFAAEAPSTVESYLAAARRSAREAAQQEAERHTTLGGLRWSAAAKPANTDSKKRTRPLLVGLVALLAIFVIAAAFLSRMAMTNPALPAPAAAVTDTKPKVASLRQVEGQLRPLPPTPPSANSQANPKVGAPAPQVIPSTQPAGTAKPPVTPTQVAQPARPAMAPLDRLTQAANAGNARAQLIVGLKYLEGDGVPANETEAAKWLIKAADAGEPVAQYRVGTLFERGRGVAVDPVKAVRWYLAAANQGSFKAMHNLAVAYAEGTGVKKDYAEASRWFLKAANLGLSDSQFNLAVLYERGLGVPQNLVDAYKWYAIAATKGDAESKARIAAITSQLDPEARAAAQHAADTFRPGQLNARANVAPTMADATRG